MIVEFSSDGVASMGYLARPAGGQGPGVVVIQEWWGLNAHIKDVAERFARAGYVALAPDLYHGQVAEEPDDARKLVMELDRARALSEIVAAGRYLHALPEVAPKRVGVIGWCMGGGLAYQAGLYGDVFAAVVGFYGRPPEAEQVPNLQAPVLALFAEHDHGMPDTARNFSAALAAAGKSHAVHIYQGAQHAFFNDTRASVYHAQHAQDAWERTLGWFQMYLMI